MMRLASVFAMLLQAPAAPPVVVFETAAGNFEVAVDVARPSPARTCPMKPRDLARRSGGLARKRWRRGSVCGAR